MSTQTIAERDREAAQGLDRADPVVIEAMRRAKACRDFESDARTRWLWDYKFAHGDAYNNYQWPDEIYSDRNQASAEKPCLTINKVRQHNLQIINDAKKNKPGVKISPVGNEATSESADVWMGLVRHVENQSGATLQYDRATEYLVHAGLGFLRVKTAYANELNFDQEIYISAPINPLNCYLDCDAVEPDKSDARYGFVMEDMPRDRFEQKYPKFARELDNLPDDLAMFPDTPGDWLSDTKVRVAEYYRRVEKPDVLYAYIADGAEAPIYIRESELKGAPEMLERVRSSPLTKKRTLWVSSIEWYFIVGTKVVEKGIWPGKKIIPLVEVAGETTIIDGQLDRKGHTRALLDCQRMYNYWSSAAVEYGALQTKTPWIASAEAIEGYETDWNSANLDTKSVLLYNALGDDGTTKIDMPMRIQPPVAAPVSLQGMATASEEMMMVSGQYQAMMGAPSNERSGKAIMERQRQGDTATYHYTEAMGQAIRKIGKIILEIAPKIYDTQRFIQIMAEDGKSFSVMIDPTAQKAYAEQQQANAGALQRIFNPAVGDYEVTAQVGPNYGTKREEAFNAFTALLGQAPQLIPILGDILFKAGDFPFAEQAAERLQRLVPPHALGVGPSPQETALQQQVDALKQMLGKLLEENSVTKIKLKGKEQHQVIDMFNAITARLKVVTEKAMSEAELKALVQDTLDDVFSTPIDAVGESAGAELDMGMLSGAGASAIAKTDQLPPGPSAKLGSDGRWYRRDFMGGGYRPV